MADRSPSNNVYTILIALAMLCMIGAIAFLVVRSNELFGGKLLDMEASARTLLTTLLG